MEADPRRTARRRKLVRTVSRFGAMLALFATVAAWSASAAERRRLAGLALAGLIVCGIASAGTIAIHRELDPAHGWTYGLAAAGLAAVLGWGFTARRPDGPGLWAATAATTAALLAGTIVREAPRLALIEHGRPTAVNAGGLPVFLATVAIGVTAIAWIVRTVRTVA